MSDDSDFTAPCNETKDGVRCIVQAHYVDGEPRPHDHRFPAVITREQIDLTETYGTIVERIPVGEGHELLVMADDCFRFAHDCDRSVRFPGGTLTLRVAPALQWGSHRPQGQQGHTIRVDDGFAGQHVVNVMPSIQCEDCGTHGFIHNGRWSAA